MSTNTKKSKSSEETLEKLRAFINEKGGIVKKEEFAALDVDYRKILEFVEAGFRRSMPSPYLPNGFSVHFLLQKVLF